MSESQVITNGYRHKKFDEYRRLAALGGRILRSTPQRGRMVLASSTPRKRKLPVVDVSASSGSPVAAAPPALPASPVAAALERPITPGTPDSSSFVATSFNATSTPLKRKLSSESASPNKHEASTSSQNSKPVIPDVELLHSALKRRRIATTPVVPAAVQTIASLPIIKPEALVNLCQYHGNMVRTFPKKERSAREQERRDKNTLACRLSRRVKKIQHMAVEVNYDALVTQHLEGAKMSIRTAAYLQELMKLVSAINVPHDSHKRQEILNKYLKIQAEWGGDVLKALPSIAAATEIAKREQSPQYQGNLFSIEYLLRN